MYLYEEKSKKIDINTSVKFNMYSNIMDRLEIAIECGIRKAFEYEHEEKPSQEYIRECVEREVAVAIDELFNFE